MLDTYSSKEMDRRVERENADTAAALADPYHNAKIAANYMCARFKKECVAEFDHFADDGHVRLTIVEAGSDGQGRPLVIAKPFNVRNAEQSLYLLIEGQRGVFSLSSL